MTKEKGDEEKKKKEHIPRKKNQPSVGIYACHAQIRI